MKFNYKKGSKTQKGKPPVMRMLTKDHALYKIYFTESGLKRSDEEVAEILKKGKVGKV